MPAVLVSDHAIPSDIASHSATASHADLTIMAGLRALVAAALGTVLLALALPPTAALLVLLLAPFLLSVVPVHQIFDGFDPEAMKGKKVLICGASGGIGEQLAYQYARLGCSVALVARREEALKAVVAKCRMLGAPHSAAVVGDMSSEASILKTVEAVLGTDWVNGSLDILVLNHAIQYWDWVLPDADELRDAAVGRTNAAVSFEFLDKTVAVNFTSYVKLAAVCTPALVRGADFSRSRSSIVVVSSGAGKLACPKQSVYAGTKHALLGFFDSFRLELEHKRLPVTVTNVILGATATEQFVGSAGEDVSWPPPCPVEEAAKGILRGGAARLEEVYYPLGQSLHLVAVLRSLVGLRWLLDRVTLAASGGRNVMSWRR